MKTSCPVSHETRLWDTTFLEHTEIPPPYQTHQSTARQLEEPWFHSSPVLLVPHLEAWSHFSLLSSRSPKNQMETWIKPHNVSLQNRLKRSLLWAWMCLWNVTKLLVWHYFQTSLPSFSLKCPLPAVLGVPPRSLAKRKGPIVGSLPERWALNGCTLQ